MRRTALLVVAALALALLPPPATRAGTVTDDVYRSRSLTRGRDGRPYVIDVTVDDRAGGALLLVSVRRKCSSCRSTLFARPLELGEFRTGQSASLQECLCMQATVETKFGGVPLRVDWVWDPEQGGGPSGGGFEWTTVTANNLMNFSCFGTGTHTSTPSLAFESPSAPENARKFPDDLPAAFDQEFPGPSCLFEGP